MADDQAKFRFAQFGECATLIVSTKLVALALAEATDWRALLVMSARL